MTGKVRIPGTAGSDPADLMTPPFIFERNTGKAWRFVVVVMIHPFYFTLLFYTFFFSCWLFWWGGDFDVGLGIPLKTFFFFSPTSFFLFFFLISYYCKFVCRTLLWFFFFP